MSFIAGTPVHREVISLRPASRDLSGDARSGNIHQHAVRGSSNTKIPGTLRSEAFSDQFANNDHALSNRLPTYLQPLTHFRSARPFMGSQGLGSDASNPTGSKHLEASRHIFSSQCMQNRHLARRPMQTLFLQRIIRSVLNTKSNWWS